MSSKDVTKVKVSHWSVDIAPEIYISERSVVILVELPHIPCRMPVQCSSVYHSLFVVLLWCADQHMDVQSFHLCPVQITVGRNTSTECYCRMWLWQQSGIKKKMYGSAFGEELYTKCLSFLLNFKYLQILKCTSFVSIYNLCYIITIWNKRKHSYQ
jgi:hypothetical protein